MPNATVAALQQVLTRYLANLEPALEGYRDDVRAMDKEEEQITVGKFRAHIEILQRLVERAKAAQTALTTLDQDGFDTIPDLLLEPDEFAVFQANMGTIDAARARTKALPQPASGGRFRLSAGVPKAT